MSLFGGGGGGSAPKAPKLQQVNVPNVEQQAVAADVQGYNLSDQDWRSRFPQLYAGREYNIGNANLNLSGQTDPAISGALKTAGFGDVNLGNTEFQQAQNMGQPILAKEQRDRSYFQNLLADNPQRAFGLSGSDVANIALGNVASQNTYNSSLYGTRVAASNQAVLQGAQNMATLYGALGSVGGAAIRAYSPSPYLSANTYASNVPYFAGPVGTSSAAYYQTPNLDYTDMVL